MENTQKIKEEIINLINQKVPAEHISMWNDFINKVNDENTLLDIRASLSGSVEDIMSVTKYLALEIEKKNGGVSLSNSERLSKIKELINK
jgi:hypothetical protein